MWNLSITRLFNMQTAVQLRVNVLCSSLFKCVLIIIVSHLGGIHLSLDITSAMSIPEHVTKACFEVSGNKSCFQGAVQLILYQLSAVDQLTPTYFSSEVIKGIFCDQHRCR